MPNAMILKPLPVVAVSASSTASGYSAGNVAREQIGLVWRSAASGSSQVLTIDLGSDQPIDTIVLTGLFGAQPGWLMTVGLATSAQGSFGGAFWAGTAQTLLAGTAMPVNGLGKALWLAPAGAPAAARYVRITFSALGGAAVELSIAAIGARLQLARNFRFGAAFGVRPMGSVEFSSRGAAIIRKGKKLRGVGISFDHVYRDEVEAAVQPLLERAGNDELITIVTDPAPDAQRQKRIYTGYLTGDLGTVWARAGGFQADFNLVAID